MSSITATPSARVAPPKPTPVRNEDTAGEKHVAQETKSAKPVVGIQSITPAPTHADKGNKVDNLA
jgi:hypothetical protein